MASSTKDFDTHLLEPKVLQPIVINVMTGLNKSCKKGVFELIEAAQLKSDFDVIPIVINYFLAPDDAKPEIDSKFLDFNTIQTVINNINIGLEKGCAGGAFIMKEVTQLSSDIETLIKVLSYFLSKKIEKVKKNDKDE
jgi:hypothetical protein